MAQMVVCFGTKLAALMKLEPGTRFTCQPSAPSAGRNLAASASLLDNLSAGDGGKRERMRMGMNDDDYVVCQQLQKLVYLCIPVCICIWAPTFVPLCCDSRTLWKCYENTVWRLFSFLLFLCK